MDAERELTKVTSQIPSSKSQLQHAETQRKQWVAEQRGFTLGHAKAEAAKLTSKLEKEASTIRAETSAEIQLLKQKAADTEAHAKQRYEAHVDANANVEDDEQANEAAARAHAD